MNTDKNDNDVATKLFEEDRTRSILGACFEVSNELGFGFLESVYKPALLIALNQHEIEAQSEVPVNVSFRGKSVGLFYVDIIVEQRIVVEIKCTKALSQEHEAQLLIS